MGLEEDSKVAVGPAVKDGSGAEALEEVKLEGAWHHKEFMSKGATLNYLGQDKSDIQYAVKIICQGMSTPTAEGEDKESREAFSGSKEAGVEVSRKGGGRWDGGSGSLCGFGFG